MIVNQFAHVMRFYSFTTFSNNSNIKQRKKKKKNDNPFRSQIIFRDIYVFPSLDEKERGK